MDNKLNRYLPLDILRGVSIIGVILLHIIGSSFHFWNEGSITWTVFISIDQFFRFSVPLFVFISGYTLYSKYSKNLKYLEFFKKRAARVLPWYFVWSLIIYIYIHQTVAKDGVHIPLALVSQYGLKQGAKIKVTLEPDGIRITPEQVDRSAIEKHALRYVLANLGDAATIEIQSLPGKGWQVNVFGAGWPEPLGKLIYDLGGNLIPEQSDTPEKIRPAHATL